MDVFDKSLSSSISCPNGSPCLVLDPVRGLFGPDHQIIDDSNSKTAQSTTSKPGEFYFLSIGHYLAEFRKIEHMNLFCFA